MSKEELTKIQSENYNEIQGFAEQARFKSIESAIILEGLISEILVNYLGNEKTKKALQKHLFYDTLTFDQKINLFNSLNKKKIFKASENDIYLNSDLVAIKLIRNYMAHSMIDTTSEFLNHYDKREIKFKSFTSRNMISNITFRIYDKEDDIDNLVFSINALIIRFTRSFNTLKRIDQELRNVD